MESKTKIAEDVEKGIREVRHLFQNEFEIGPAGRRHKIRYYTEGELKSQIEFLENMGLLDTTQ